MLVNPFTGVVNSALSGASPNGGANKIQKAITQLAAGNRITQAADDVSSLSIAKNLQNEVTGLRSALNNTSQLDTMLQVADNDIQQIQEALTDAKALAVQVKSGAVNAENRAALDQQFQSKLAQITTIAKQSKFGGVSLLDGSISGANALNLNSILGDESDDVELSIESLDAESLLGSNLSLATDDAAEQAINAVQQAFNMVGTAQASVGAFAEQLDVTSAYIATAMANQDAARSTLEDADFATAATALSQAKLQEQAAIQVQAKRLPPSMVEQLIN